MKRLSTYLAIGLLTMCTTVNAATFAFNEDLLAGSDPSDSVRQIIATNQRNVNFNIASDVFAFDPAVFGVSQFLFTTDLSGNVPASGVNVVVLQDPAPLNAGVAADRIAAAITDPGPGFFIYFNTNLDLPRLVFSRDLSDATADLAVLARLTNLSGAPGFAQLPNFTETNFAPIPEPSSLLLTSADTLLTCVVALRRRRPRA